MHTHTVLRVPLVVLVMLLSSACIGGDQRPGQHESMLNPYARLYADVQDAFLHSSELADPKTVEQANRHYGFTGDSPLRVVQWKDRRAHTFCIVNRDTGTYYIQNARWELLGDGDCSARRAGAVAVYDTRRTLWVKGVDVVRDVVDPIFLTPADRADPAHHAGQIAHALLHRIRHGGRAPRHLGPEFLRTIGVSISHHHEVARYRVTRSGRAFVLCVVHRPSGAWAFFDSTARLGANRPGSIVGVGDSGATCAPDRDSLTSG